MTGHTDELFVERDGDISQSTSFSGDGSDVYAQYWATQAKQAGTTVYVVGYDLVDAMDAVLLQNMASPGGYFPGSPGDITNVFEAITLDICDISITKLRTSAATVLPAAR